LIAISDELVRDAIAAFVETKGAFTVAGSTGDGEDALAAVIQLRPRAVVMDLDLTRLHTMELISQLRDKLPEVRLIVVVGRSDRKTVVETLRCGAHGLVLRSGPSSHLLNAIEQTIRGGVYITPLLNLEKLFVSWQTYDNPDPLSTLSTREFQVYSMLIQGVRGKEIAARLSLSPKTVHTYQTKVMKKLNIHDVAGLVRFSVNQVQTENG